MHLPLHVCKQAMALCASVSPFQLSLLPGFTLPIYSPPPPGLIACTQCVMPNNVAGHGSQRQPAARLSPTDAWPCSLVMVLVLQQATT
jgi:hypothetical protein